MSWVLCRLQKWNTWSFSYRRLKYNWDDSKPHKTTLNHNCSTVRCHEKVLWEDNIVNQHRLEGSTEGSPLAEIGVGPCWKVGCGWVKEEKQLGVHMRRLRELGEIRPRWNWERPSSWSLWSVVKHLSTTWETRVRSLGREDPLKKEMATHSSTLAWKIPWMEEPGGLQSMGSGKVRHDWVTSLSLSLCVNVWHRLWLTCRSMFSLEQVKRVQEVWQKHDKCQERELLNALMKEGLLSSFLSTLSSLGQT